METPDVDIDVATMDFRACPALLGRDGRDRGPSAPPPLETVVWIDSGRVGAALGYGGALEEPALS
ncbi:hypothetical protein GCM10017673_57420 [Streptosporangium violaceochromogenes]|nr:hypothetical protein GCM10017673_57420 [Streptosporangium violaceochromogenes]